MNYNKGYIAVAVLLVLLGLLVALLPLHKAGKEVSPDQLLEELTSSTRFLSPDRVAADLIAHDPSLLLIDVRSKAEYDSFNIEGSVHIPVDSLMTGQSTDLLANPALRKVFCSTDDTRSALAWMLARRMGFKQIYILEGGLNNWFRTIIRPEQPGPEASQAEHDLYLFREAAGNHFLGLSAGTPLPNEAPVGDKPKKVITAPVHKKAAEGGC